MRQSGKWVATLLSLSVLVALAVFLRTEGAGPKAKFLPKCYLNHLTDLYCPGCGNTRVAYALLHGDVYGALRQNVLTVVALPFLLWGGFRLWFGWIKPEAYRPITWWRSWHTWLLALVILCFGVLRNVPVKPFSWLAPVPVSRGIPIEVREVPHPGDQPPVER